MRRHLPLSLSLLSSDSVFQSLLFTSPSFLSPQMDGSLPDEILSEILTPFLQVSEAQFSDTDRNSPFADRIFSGSTSAVLLVCKSWLRVATPLLYHVVILRSKAQAQALEAVLRKNKDLGKFIKKLRVEGGFGPSMQLILKSSPNVTDVCVSFQLRATENSSGLVAGLPAINPRRLVVLDDPNNVLVNKSVVQLVKIVSSCAADTWTNLSTMVLPYRFIIRDDLMKAICSSSTLKTVSFPALRELGYLAHLVEIANNPSIEAIKIDIPAQRVIPAVHERVAAHPRLKLVIKWGVDRSYKPPPPLPEPPMFHAPNPSFSPMVSTPQPVRDSIWERVLFFAMIAEAPRAHRLHVLDQYRYNKKVNSNRLQFLLVCKAFHRLGLPLLYGYPLFANRYGARGFSEKLAAGPSLGEHVREIRTYKGMLFKLTDSPPEDVDLFPILSCTPRLRLLVGEDFVPMEWKALEALAKSAGETLVEFAGYHITRGGSEAPSIKVFEHLTALRILRWSCEPFSAVTHPKSTPSGLRMLEVLEVDSCDIFSILALFQLPKLYRLVVHCSTVDYDAFLQKHGINITELTVCDPVVGESSFFEHCQRMQSMTVMIKFWEGSETDLSCFHLNHPHTHLSLKKLVIHKYPQRLKADEEKEWSQFFSSVDTSLFPALAEIQSATCKWPTTEHAISKSFWVKGAEMLLERGIKLTDSDGIAWRPRLKSRRR
ncbi:hypothetical protein C8R43DRAFT_925670 [Mycena crocata]|nr:hypothetical protein C8R43DRAFT_925670 [Mycena crocata]